MNDDNPGAAGILLRLLSDQETAGQGFDPRYVIIPKATLPANHG